MEILLIGRRGQDRRVARSNLEAAGHTVHTCFERDGFGCSAMTDQCPLENKIDLAVATTSARDGTFDPQGVTCAHRHRVPVVAVGASPADPIIPYVAAVVDDPDDVLCDVVERVHARPSRPHSDAIRAALAPVLGANDRVDVHSSRTKDGVSVILDITGPIDVPDPAIVERARQAVRRFDPEAPSVTVSVTHRPAADQAP